MRNLSLILVIIGFFRFDLISNIFSGSYAIVARVVFALVGLAGVYAISLFFRRNESV